MTKPSIRVERGEGQFFVRGYTGAIKADLLAAGAVWQEKGLCWAVAGEALPSGIQSAIDDVLGIVRVQKVIIPAPPTSTAAAVADDPTDTWVKSVNDAARAADAAFAEAMNTSPVVHLAMTDPDVVKATNKFVKVASGGTFSTPDEVLKNTPQSSHTSPDLHNSDVNLPQSTNLPESAQIENSPSDEPVHSQQFITIQCKGDEERKVPADIFGQIAVHRSAATRDKWVITHVASGRTVSANRVSPTDTIALAEALASAFDFDGWLENRVPMSEHDQSFGAGVKAFLDAWDMQPVVNQVQALVAVVQS